MLATARATTKRVVSRCVSPRRRWSARVEVVGVKRSSGVVVQMRGKDDDDDGRAREGGDDSTAGYSLWEYRRACSCGRSGGGGATGSAVERDDGSTARF